MIKAIIFDYGGVFTIEGDFDGFIDIFAKKFGVNREEFKKLLIDVWLESRVNKIDSRNFWKVLSKFLKTDEKSVRDGLLDFSGFSYEVLEFVKKLKGKYKLGMLSNQIEDWLEEVIDKHNMNELFDVIVTSYGSKLAKPDPAIYKKVIEELDVKPEECVYIDDMEINISPAKELGIKTILFKDFEQMKSELKEMGVE